MPILHRLLAPELPDCALFAFVTEVRGARADEPWHAHNGEDFLYVLEGTLAVHLADRDPAELHPGDSLQMVGRIGHSLVALPARGSRSRATPTARVLWIGVPFAPRA